MKLFLQILVVCIAVTQITCQICSSHTSATSLMSASPLSRQSPAPSNCGGSPCDTYVWGNYWNKMFTAQLTCFGWFGPLGQLGPLGPYGPAELREKQRDTKYSGEVVDMIRLSNEGPLSIVGPLGDTPFFDTMINDMTDFTKHMQGQGIWSILGPLGPLGPLGGLGPLGDKGIHGYTRNADGDYYQGNTLKNTIHMKWVGNDLQEWPLFESYTQERAQKLSEQRLLDTSFSVLEASGTQTFNVKSEGNQFVSILAVPRSSGQVYSVYVHDNDKDFNISNVKSDSYQFINWVQVKIEEASEFSITVKGSGDFNLYVVGSTPFMSRQQHIQYSGDYIKEC